MVRLLSKQAVQLIEGKNYGFLTSLLKGGWPHVTPVWVDHEDERYVLVNTAEERTKVRNVRRDPRVAICIFDHEKPRDHGYVSIKGRVVSIIGGREAWQHRNKLWMKYQGRRSVRSQDMKRFILRIQPLREY